MKIQRKILELDESFSFLFKNRENTIISVYKKLYVIGTETGLFN